MSTSIEVFSKVNEYIERRMSLRELEYWIVYMLPIYLSNPGSAVAELAGTIELGIAEIKAEIRSERSLRKLLAQHISGNPIKYESYPYVTSSTETIASGSLTEARNLEWLDLSPSSSSEPQVEYV